MKGLILVLTLILNVMVFAGQEIENSLTPAHAKAIGFEVDLSLGLDEGDPNQMFGSNINFAVSGDEEIVILDPAGEKVLVFNKKGEFSRTFGKKGQGPGEFQAPSEIAIAPDKSIWVFDAMTQIIAIFNPDGTWKENRNMPQSVRAVLSPQILDSGLLVMTVVKLDEQFQQAYVLGTMGEEKESFNPILSMATPKVDWNKMQEPGFWEEFLRGHFEAIGKGFPVAVSMGDTFVGFNASEYKGTSYSQDSIPVWTMTKVTKPRPFTEQAKRTMCEAIYDGVRSSGPIGSMLNDGIFNSAFRKARLPEFMLPISALFPWEKGFGVLTNFNSEERIGTIHLFDKKGVFQYEGLYQGPGGVRVLKNNYLYANGPDEEDVMKVVRFKVKGI